MYFKYITPSNALLNVLYLLAIVSLSIGYRFRDEKFSLICENKPKHDLEFGKTSKIDSLLYWNRTVRAGRSLMRHKYDLEIPAHGSYARGLITKVQLIDQLTDGSGGCAYIGAGGPGHHRVLLHFESQYRSPVDFVIKIYGH